MSIGNLKDSGNQGNNFPWQLKMLLGQQCACDELAAINENTNDVEFLLTAILTSLQDGTEYEAKFVVDTCDVARTVYLEVRIWDPTPPPGSWGPITYYLPGSSTPVVPPGAGTPGCLQYMDPTGILGMIYNVLNTRLDVNLSTRASESTLSTLNAKFVNGTDIGDVTINNAGGASAVNIQDGGNSITVDANNLDIRDLVFATDKVDVSNSTIALDVTTLTALENITVQNGAGASAVNIQDGGNSITIDATALPLPTGAATEATLLDVKTSVQLIDNCVGTDNTTAPPNSFVVAGVTAAGVQQTIDVGTNGHVHIADGGGSITVDSNAAVRTPTVLRVSASGTIAAGAYSVSFASVGTVDATVGGVTLKVNETINFDAGGINNTLASIAYDSSAAGAELLIITLT
jgi:hypothetical protein